MEENIEDINSPSDEVVSEPESDEVGLPADPIEVEPIDEETAETDKDAIIAELRQKQQETYEQLKKAKGFIRDKDGKWVKKEEHKVVQKDEPVTGDITKTELYSLVKANVPEEDTQEVITYARSRGMTVTEALKTPEVKAILGVRKEYRNTAEATNAGGSRRGSSKISDETLLSNAEKGIMPEKQEDLERLIKARKGIK